MGFFDRFKRQPAPIPATVAALAPSPEDARADSWFNESTGLGTQRDNATCNSYAMRQPIPWGTLGAIYEGSRIVSRGIDLEPNTALAKGFFVPELDSQDAIALESELLKLNAFATIADAMRWGRLYGGGIVYMQVNDGRPSDAPVDVSRIIAVHSLTSFDLSEISVLEWNSNVGSRNHGKPEIYIISSYSGTFNVHYTRVLTFSGLTVPRRRSMRYQGFGPSIIYQTWDAINQYGSIHAYLTGAVAKITQGVLKLKGLNDSLKGSMASKIVNRLRALMSAMSVIGDVVVDADNEGYDIIQRPMTGFREAAELAEARFVGEWGVPKSILMGQAPGGLANGENGGDWQMWANHIGTVQTTVLDSPCKRLVGYMLAARDSTVVNVPDVWTIGWPSVLQLSDAEKATIYATKAAGRASDIASAVISPVEARQSDDVIETYHLEANQLEVAAEAPAVEPLSAVGT